MPRDVAPRRTASAADRALAAERLAASGLDERDAQDLGLTVLSAADLAALGSPFYALPALRIPYLDPFTGKPSSSWPSHPPFYRVRYLARPAGFVGKTKKVPRYCQPAVPGCCAYFPAVGGVDWKTIAASPGVPIVVTEGEFKAAKATKEGFPTIGLGGVWNFRAASLGVGFLKELSRVDWVGRIAYVAFDSDVATNEDVRAALRALGDELTERGAFPRLVALPDVGGAGKTGLDDFLLAEGAEALGKLMAAAPPFGLAEPLWDLNDRVAYVADPGVVVVKATRQKMSPAAFGTHAFANIRAVEHVVSDKGVTVIRPVAAADAWLRWPLRDQAARFVYAPGAEARTADNELNLWKGWGVAPKRGNVDRFLKLLKHLFVGAPPDDMAWFLQWLAYPLQHPGTKMHCAAVLFGVTEGTGKSLVGYTMGKIYGANFVEIKEQDLHASFNEWAVDRQFVMGDEITGSDKRAEIAALQRLITQRSMRVNVKHVPSYEVADCVNYLFTTNKPDAFFMSDSDRRFFVHEVTARPMPAEFYEDYTEGWLYKDTAAASAVFDYLLRVDLAGFNPGAPAWRTAARARMVMDSKSDLAEWVARLREAPGDVLRVGTLEIERDVWSPRELLPLYDPHGVKKVSAVGVGRELKRAGFRQVLDGQPIRTPEGGQDRYYALRNEGVWLRASGPAVSAHLRSTFGGGGERKEKKF